MMKETSDGFEEQWRSVLRLVSFQDSPFFTLFSLIFFKVSKTSASATISHISPVVYDHSYEREEFERTFGL